MPRAKFSGVTDAIYFVLKFNDYISYNKIQDKNKYWVLNCSFKGQAQIWLQKIGKYLVIGETKRFEQTCSEFKKAFPAFRDKHTLRREFCCSKQSIFDNTSKFFLHTLHIRN